MLALTFITFTPICYLVKKVFAPDPFPQIGSVFICLRADHDPQEHHRIMSTVANLPQNNSNKPIFVQNLTGYLSLK